MDAQSAAIKYENTLLNPSILAGYRGPPGGVSSLFSPACALVTVAVSMIVVVIVIVVMIM